MHKGIAFLILCALCGAAIAALLISTAAIALTWLQEPAAPEAAPIDDPTQGGREMELVEQYWGYFYDIAFQDNLVYAIAGQRFYVFSLVDPANPVLLGKSKLMLNYSLQMDIDGAYAYLADPGITWWTVSPGAGLHVLDISNPAAPSEIAFSDSTYYGAMDVDVFDGYAYIADAFGYLVIVDVSNPAAPSRVKSLYLSTDPISQVQVAQHPVDGKTYAYAISHENEIFYAVDVSNPLQPALASSLALPVYWLRDFAVQGARALMVDDVLGNLHLLDLTNPAQPVLVESSDYPPGEKVIYNFDLFGDYLLANELGSETGLLVMDASGPGLPVEIGFYPGQLKSVIGAQVNGVQLALVNSGFGFEVVSIANPALPGPLGSFAEEGAVDNVRVVGDLVYFSGGQGLRIYRRVGAGMLEYVGGLNVPGYLRLVQDGKAYLGYEYFDLSIGSPRYRFFVVGVSNPSQPLLLDSLDLQSPVLDVSVYGTYAYLASRGLMILDISNPAELVVTAVYSDIMSTSYPVSSPLEVAPNPDDSAQLLAYLADSENGLVILDVTHPLSVTLKLAFKPYELRNPSALDFVELPGESGKYLAIASQFNENLSLVDVTHPFSPTLLASAYINCFPHSLMTTPGRVYVACDLDGGRLYLAGPTQLDERGYYRIPYKVKDVAVSGEFIYMAAGAEGLFEVWQAPMNWAQIPITGGLMTSEYYSLTIDFPADTFTETTDLTLRPRFYGNMPSAFRTIGADYYYELYLLYTNYRDRLPLKPYQVEWQYDPADFPGIDESTLGLYYWDEVRWVREPSSSVDTTANLISAAPQQFNLWALLAERQGVQEIFLPMVNR